MAGGREGGREGRKEGREGGRRKSAHRAAHRSPRDEATLLRKFGEEAQEMIADVVKAHETGKDTGTRNTRSDLVHSSRAAFRVVACERRKGKRGGRSEGRREGEI